MGGLRAVHYPWRPSGCAGIGAVDQISQGIAKDHLHGVPAVPAVVDGIVSYKGRRPGAVLAHGTGADIYYGFSEFLAAVISAHGGFLVRREGDLRLCLLCSLLLGGLFLGIGIGADDNGSASGVICSRSRTLKTGTYIRIVGSFVCICSYHTTCSHGQRKKRSCRIAYQFVHISSS